jgi:glycosyltransferase involved in cell wall biosynthesis
MKISVLTTAYPTPEEPNRGAPIWAILDRFRGKVEFQVNCSLARSPNWVRRLIQPRSYLRYPGQVDMTRCPELPAALLEYFSVPGVTRWFNGRLLARVLERHVARWRPDVILAYRIYPDGYAAVAVGKRLGIPAVISSRGSDLRKIPARGLARRDTVYAVRHADAVLCVSEDLMRIAQSLGSSNVHLVRNGVNRAVFHPMDQAEARRQLAVPQEQRLIVFVGNLIPIKDVPTLLQAVRILKAAGEIWHMALIGEGRQEPELRHMTEQLGIATQVSFLGSRSALQVAIWLNACDVFCLPSESEGLPNVVIEALACGRNVVGTNVGGIPELLTEKTGIVIPRAAPAAMAEALSQSGKRQWDREFIARSYPWSWDDVAAQTLHICREAVRLGAIDTQGPSPLHR